MVIETMIETPNGKVGCSPPRDFSHLKLSRMSERGVLQVLARGRVLSRPDKAPLAIFGSLVLVDVLVDRCERHVERERAV